MWFRLFYIVYLIAELLYSNFTLPFIGSPRVALSFIMFFVLLLQNAFIIDKYTKYFLFFVFFYLFSSVITGDFSGFIARFVRLYFVAVVVYSATKLMITEYDGFKIVIRLLLIIGVIDAFVTVGQVLQLSIVNEFTNLLSLNQDEKFLESIEIASTKDISLQMFVFPGLFGYVENAYFLCFISVLAFYNSNGVPRLWNWIIWLIIIVALACTQERTALILSVLLSFVAVYRIYNNINKTTENRLLLGVILFCFVVFIVSGYEFLISHETRFAELGFDNAGRDLRYNQAISYIADHVIEGGITDYLSTNYYPHNIFLLSLLYGGLFGFISICFLFYAQLSNIWQYIIRDVDVEQIPFFIISLSFIAYSANSLTHNLSVVSGDASPWIIWGVFVGLTNKSDLINDYLYCNTRFSR